MLRWSATVKPAYVGASCATKPTRPDRIAASGVPPSTRTAPAVGPSRPTISCSSVVLPAPFGPTRPTIALSGTASVQSYNAHRRR